MIGENRKSKMENKNQEVQDSLPSGEGQGGDETYNNSFASTPSKEGENSSPPLPYREDQEGSEKKLLKILVIDNYDSFVYNLVHYLEEFDCTVTVKRNNELDLDEVEDYDKILLSPGPGIPDEAGLLKEIIFRYASKKSILGVCLGQQAIGEVFGGKIMNLKEVFHGVSSKIKVCVNDEPLFCELEPEIEVGRYHSWVVNKELPACLEATSFDENGQVMSLRHRSYDVRGVQFHPESVLTPHGKKIIQNWINSNQKIEKDSGSNI